MSGGDAGRVAAVAGDAQKPADARRILKASVEPTGVNLIIKPPKSIQHNSSYEEL